MRIIIDADACPKNVKNICEEISLINKIPLIMVIDNAHELSGSYSVIVVEKGKDSVDHEIVTIAGKDDIIITQDYGLAAMILENVRGIIHPDGFTYNKYNMDILMYQRHLGQKARNSGAKTKNHKKRTHDLDNKFRTTIEKMIQNSNI